MNCHILYSCNRNYVVQTITSIESLLCHNKELDIIIHLVYDGFTKKELEAIWQLADKHNRVIELIPIQEWMEGWDVPMHTRHPITIYSKIFSDKITDTDRVLYLDSDTIITSSLEELFQMELHGYVAGVMMQYSAKKKDHLGNEKETPYLCDGILMIHVALWRRDQIRHSCLQYIKACNGEPKGLSEGVINHVCGRNKQILHPKYNLMSIMILLNVKQIRKLFRVTEYYREEDRIEALNQPAIIHYLAELYERPWINSHDHPYGERYEFYCKQAGMKKCTSNQRPTISTHTKITRFALKVIPLPLLSIVFHLCQKWQS